MGMNEVRSCVGFNIHHLRKTKGMRQSDLAEKAGLKQPNLSRIENGIVCPRTSTLQKIAAVLGVEVETFYKPVNFEFCPSNMNVLPVIWWLNWVEPKELRRAKLSQRDFSRIAGYFYTHPIPLSTEVPQELRPIFEKMRMETNGTEELKFLEKVVSTPPDLMPKPSDGISVQAEPAIGPSNPSELIRQA